MAVRMMGREARPDTKLANQDGRDYYGLRPEDYDVTYEGAVLGTYEENGYNDSDFFAVVWSEKAQALTSVCFGTTRGWTYPNGATVDATDEVKEKALAWLNERDVKHSLWVTCRDALVPEKGKRAEVAKARKIKGRQIEEGQTGTIIWRGIDRYKSSRHYTAYRVGLKLDGEEEPLWLPEEDVRVIEVELPSREEAEERFGYRDAFKTNFVSAYRSLGGALNLRNVMYAEAGAWLAHEVYGVPVGKTYEEGSPVRKAREQKRAAAALGKAGVA